MGNWLLAVQDALPHTDELMAVAREYRQRGIPLSVIVADFFHWPHLGDWRFEPNEWPDPTAMVDELEAMGTTLMVSVWPSVSPLSDNACVGVG